ncbi:sporulation histidine kinase inhibitor Sda [Mesobacillus jeotgali]|uniref:sporulation histidine kinase inhibitor Sda n=1 Tax=Mesobacillus jeotgali TaxID=129985 RepID=UPI00222617BD|nr:sporulation histidine kinase inhibitor Sda [Mesobacillus jeotgali]UYZ21621.1 sporulation histidine kinase inhibitor Sda [Mesobacillus jeotgali]
MVNISTLWELTDEKLLEAYQKATLLNLDETFIEMLMEEINNRGLKSLEKQYVS